MPGVSDRYRDSIRSSDYHYTNPYRQDFDYCRAERARAINNRVLDKLETTQESIEKELLEKILGKKGKLNPQNFIILQQIGKVFFIVLMLPPYILFYGAPKSALKKFFPIAKRIITQISFTMNKFAALSSLYLEKIYIWPLGKIRSLRKKINQKGNDLKVKIYNRIIYPTKHFVELVRNTAKQFAARLTQPFSHFSTFLKKQITRFAFPVKSFKPKIFSFHISLPKLSFNFVSLHEIRKRIGKKISNVANQTKDKVQGFFHNSIKFIETGWLFLWNPISRFKIPNYKLPNFSIIKEKYAKFLQNCLRISKATSDTLKAVQNRFLNYSQRIMLQLQKAKKQITPYALKLFENISTKWNTLRRLLNNKKKSNSNAKHKLKALYKKTREKCAQTIDLMSYYIKYAASTLLQWIAAIGRKIGVFIKNFFMSIRIFYALICILLRFLVQGIKAKLVEEINNL